MIQDKNQSQRTDPKPLFNTTSRNTHYLKKGLCFY